MKKINSFVLILSAFISVQALAIDQVTLKNGDVVEGKVLTETPLHVDIQLVNGTMKRFQKAEFTSVDRDVPSTKDKTMVGNESNIYLGGLAGMSLLSGGSSTQTNFNWGARFGVLGNPSGDLGRFSAGLAYDRFSVTGASIASVMAQFTLQKFQGTGFYFGPELGLGIFSLSTGSYGGSTSANFFEYGALLGYDYFLSSGFSFGPEIHFDHNNSASFGGPPTINVGGGNALKILFGGTFHF